MRSRLRTLLVVPAALAPLALWPALFVAGCGQTESEPRGTWVGQSATVANGVGSFREKWTFQDGTIVVGEWDSSSIGKTYRVDATKEPKEIDITLHYPSGETSVRKGIYKIEKDTLVISECIPVKDKPDAARPGEFFPPRKDVVTLTFHRQE
jgi:uncharacterized protein (TIGR03067 family)